MVEFGFSGSVDDRRAFSLVFLEANAKEVSCRVLGLVVEGEGLVCLEG